MVYQRPSRPAFQLCSCNTLPILCKGIPSPSTPPTTTKSPAVHISVPSNRSNFNVALPALRDARVDPITSTIVAAAAVLGWLTGRLTSPFRRKSQDKAVESIDNESQSSNTDGKQLLTPSGVSEIVKTPTGENAIWLNMSIRTLWRLFRKSTNTVTKEVLQPVLDDMELPDLVKKVTITKLTMGESPALVRKIKRLPSRSLSEIQYRFGLRLVGDANGVIDMDVSVRLPGFSTSIVIPVSVSQLDIDSSVWVGFTVVPYKPWVRFAQWALVKMPLIKMKISVAKVIPLTAVPILSNVMNKILTQDVPREFLFPKTQVVDLMGKDETYVEIEQDLLEAQGMDPKMKGMSDEQLRASFPKLTAFFDAMDLDNDSVLNVKEVVQGLIEWGYASKADQNSIYNLLDIDKDGFVQLREFISIWGDLKNVFVPRRFRGVVTGVLLKAEGLRTPLFGASNPYVVFSVEQQETISKRNKETSKRGSKIGSAVWNESWELFVQHPRTAMLRVEVREGCAFAYYREYIAPRPKPTSHSGTSSEIDHVEQANGLDRIIGYGTISIVELEGQAQTLWVDLRTGGGRVKIDVQFSEFVDPKFLG